MSARNHALILLAIALVFAPRPASAWESQCRIRGSSLTAKNYEWSICLEPGELAPNKECANGLEFPRGTQLGEHSYLARQALGWAGLGRYQADPIVMRYYVDGGDVTPGDSSTPQSAEPAGMGAMKAIYDRNISIPEFANVPDGSYSVSDYVLGNEHCLPPNAMVAESLLSKLFKGDIDRVNACHTYKSHVASVNSAHFAPQSASMYRLYHGIAMAMARRCAAIQAATAGAWKGTPNHPLAARAKDIVASCEREALAFQGAAAHFAGDAWSTGHMWQRWGEPNFPITAEAQTNALAVGMVSGMIHGWRSVVREVPTFGLSGYQHDQLCMPGSFEPVPPGEVASHWREMVQWRYPDEVKPIGQAPQKDFHDPLLGGGDVYLLKCTAKDNDPQWAVMPDEPDPDASPSFDNGTRPLSGQYKRMMTCLAKGFEEVYNAGPQLSGTLVRPAPFQFDDLVGTSDGDACFRQRVTNNSMWLGAGISSLAKFGNLDPAWIVKVTLTSIPDVAAAQGDPGYATLIANAIGSWLPLLPTSSFRKELAIMGLLMARQALRDPTGTSLAELEPQETDDPPPDGGFAVPGANATGLFRKFLGVPRNQDATGSIDNDGVAYLEKHDPTTWSARPVNNVKDGTFACSSDDDCPHGAFCARSVVDRDGQVARGCMRHEGAVIRAFRDAEVAHACADDSLAELNASRKACSDVVGTSKNPYRPECDACVEMVLPHVRNACSQGAYQSAIQKGQLDRRSTCDVLQQAAGVPGAGPLVDPKADVAPIYATYDPSFVDSDRGETGLGLAVRSACATPGTWSSPAKAGQAPVGRALTAAAPSRTFLKAGPRNTCQKTCDTCIYCWGGDLGGGEFAFGGGGSPVPAPLSAAWSDVVDVAIGADGYDAYTGAILRGYACALRADGTVWCAGNDDHNQLGDGARAFSPQAVQVAGIGGATAVEASSANAETCAILGPGAPVSCWGGNGNNPWHGPEGSPVHPVPGTEGATKIALGGALGYEAPSGGAVVPGPHCVLKTGGEVACWNAAIDPFLTENQLPPTWNIATSAIPIANLPGAVDVSSEAGFEAHVVTGSGQLWSFWDIVQVPCTDPHSQFCDRGCPQGTACCSSLPARYAFQVPDVPASTAVSGRCAIGSDSSVWCWQSLQPACCTGSFCDPFSTSIYGPPSNYTQMLTNATALASGFDHTCAIGTDPRTGISGTYCWGANDVGQLGDPTFTGTYTDSPRLVALDAPAACAP